MTYSERVSMSSKNNNDYSLQMARWFLMPIGIWPRMSTATKAEKFSSYMHILVCMSLIAIVAVPFFLYVSLEEKDIETKLSMIGPLSHWIMGMINYCLLLARSNDIRECVRHMEMDWRLIKRFEDRQVMLQQAKIGRFVAVICAIFMQSGTFIFAIAKSLTTTIVIVSNETISMRLMACPIYSKFIDTRFSPANEIMQIIEMISTFIVNSVTVSVCSLDAIFAMHAYAQLSVLFSWLNKLIMDKNNGNNCAERRLAIIVEHHLRVLRCYVTNYNCVYAFQFYIAYRVYYAKYLSRGIAGMYNEHVFTCILLYYGMLKIRKNWNTFDVAKLISFVIIYLSMAFNIFVFCYIGEILTEQCKNVGKKAYMINWYELPHETALGIILIIARSSNVIRITAGKFFQLSIATFGDIIKTSMVYLNMLRTMSPSA